MGWLSIQKTACSDTSKITC